MTSVDVLDPAGQKQGSIDLDDAWFGIEPNVQVMHQVVTAQLASRRAGTQSTKTRSEVRGGGAKPWKQKGTGRARQGSIRSPQWRGGGVALGPKPRSYKQRTPKKMIRLALRSALSDRAAEGKVLVVDSWGWDAPHTKDAVAALQALAVEGRALVVLGPEDEAVWKSFRNLRQVSLLEQRELNAYDVLCSDVVIFTRETLPSGTTAVPAEDEDDGPVVTPVEVSSSTDAAVADEVVAEPAEAEPVAAEEPEPSEPEPSEPEASEPEPEEGDA
jgi:large subunit ribosomal protein L4